MVTVILYVWLVYLNCATDESTTFNNIFTNFALLVAAVSLYSLCMSIGSILAGYKLYCALNFGTQRTMRPKVIAVTLICQLIIVAGVCYSVLQINLRYRAVSNWWLTLYYLVSEAFPFLLVVYCMIWEVGAAPKRLVKRIVHYLSCSCCRKQTVADTGSTDVIRN
jgi:hypothetical protein